MLKSCSVCSVEGISPKPPTTTTASKKQKPLKHREAKKASLQLVHAYNKGLLLYRCYKC